MEEIRDKRGIERRMGDERGQGRRGGDKRRKKEEGRGGGVKSTR